MGLIEFYDEVPNPAMDGIDHINIYSRGKTKLGRMLSNFYHSEVHSDEYGTFQSLEGFWYWYFSISKDDNLRNLVGAKAKRYGQTLERTEFVPEAIPVMESMMIAKVMQNENIYNELKSSTLPFTHYYVYDSVRMTIDNVSWFTEAYEKIREIIKSQ